MRCTTCGKPAVIGAAGVFGCGKHVAPVTSALNRSKEPGPNFRTPDVLPSGQTGWDLTLSQRVAVRHYYRSVRTAHSREAAARFAARYTSDIAAPTNPYETRNR